MKYASGLVTGFMMGVGATCAGLLYLHARGEINLLMLDKTYVRQMYQPKARGIRNLFDYSYHGRHYDPFVDHRPEEPVGTVTNVEEDGDGLRFHIKKTVNPDCHDCRYVTRPSSCYPCNDCKRAFDGYPNDYYYKETRECNSNCVHFDTDMDFAHYCTYCKRNSEVKDGEDFYETGDDFNQCYKCLHFETESDHSPCVDCKHNVDDGVGPDNFEYNPNWEDDTDDLL